MNSEEGDTDMGCSDIVPAKPGDIVIYQSPEGLPAVECVFHGDSMWLTQTQMVELYQVSKKTISEHINNIFDEGELDANSVVRKFRTTASDGKNYQVNYYSLEMVLTVFEGEQPTREEAEIAKNYLDEKELKRLNNLVSAFFDLAELRAETHQPMYMKDWIRELDDFAGRYGEGVLVGAGKANHKGAMTKAHKEYDAYRARIASEETAVDRAFLDGIKGLRKEIEGGFSHEA